MEPVYSNRIFLPSQKLRINCTKVAIKYQIGFADFKLLTEWLDCYQYVLPAKRLWSCAISIKLLTHYSLSESSSSAVFKTYLISDLIESTLTLKEQSEILLWMNDSNF